MNEASDVLSHAPAVILLSFWWLFLSMLDFLFTPRESEEPPQTAPKTKDDNTSTVTEDPHIAKIRELDPAFKAESFLRGARRAYEAVLHAYALGDLTTLRPLLSPDVLKVFADTCAERVERHETLELTLIGIETAEIRSIEITPEAMEITVLFGAQIVSAERSAAGDVISGDPAAVRATADLWTFSRPLPLEGEEWVIVATDEG